MDIINHIKAGIILKDRYEHGKLYYGLKLILFADENIVITSFIGVVYWNNDVYLTKDHYPMNICKYKEFIDDVMIKNYEFYPSDNLTLNSIIDNKINVCYDLIDTLKYLHQLRSINVVA